MFKQKSGKQRYIALTYRLNEGAREIVIVHLEDKSEDEWLMARLYQFTSCLSNVHLEIAFECYENYLLVEGIEFRPMKINVKAEHNDELVLLEQKYQEILKSVEPPLIYTSVQELKLLLSKGVILNRGKTWFYLNDKGQHCEMISIQECIIPDAGKSYDYVSNYNSRFLVGAYHEITCDFKIRVRAQFLTPLITYTMNLVFKFDAEKEQPKQPNIHLKYKLEGETKTSTYFANKREDDWWMVELFQFTSKGTTDDRDIIFEGNDPYIVVEGIEFRPI